jgi:hypothetical protein
MRDEIVWKPVVMDTEKHGRRTVYVKHCRIQCGLLIPAADTAFSIPARIRVKGKRIAGFVTPRDGMAYQQEHEPSWFVAYTEQ